MRLSGAAPQRGFLQAELLMGLAIGTIIFFGVLKADVGQLQMQQSIQQYLGERREKGDAALTVLLIARELEQADRFRILNTSPGYVQYRVFVPRIDAPPTCPVGSCTTAGMSAAPCCMDLVGNYRWREFRHDGAGERVEWFPASTGPTRCDGMMPLYGHITALTFNYQDTDAPAPPGGDPAAGVFAEAPADLNLMAYTLYWDNGKGLTRRYTGTAAGRGIPYSDMDAGATDGYDSGMGLEADGTDIPPAPCP